MKSATKMKLKMAQIYCDQNDKSTEFMLEYMRWVAGVDLDCVLLFLKKYGNKRWDELEEK